MTIEERIADAESRLSELVKHQPFRRYNKKTRQDEIIPDEEIRRGFIKMVVEASRQDGIEAGKEASARIVEEEYRQSLLRNDPNPGIDPLLTATKIRAHS